MTTVATLPRTDARRATEGRVAKSAKGTFPPRVCAFDGCFHKFTPYSSNQKYCRLCRDAARLRKNRLYSRKKYETQHRVRGEYRSKYKSEHDSPWAAGAILDMPLGPDTLEAKFLDMPLDQLRKEWPFIVFSACWPEERERQCLLSMRIVQGRYDKEIERLRAECVRLGGKP